MYSALANLWILIVEIQTLCDLDKHLFTHLVDYHFQIEFGFVLLFMCIFVTIHNDSVLLPGIYVLLVCLIYSYEYLPVGLKPRNPTIT